MSALASLWLGTGYSEAQTPGIIVKAAGTGRPVLDPNGDGYVSASTAGFATDDRTESEISFVPIKVPSTEPISDLANGPSGGFSDFVDLSGAVASAYMYLSADSNLLFRFRLGGIAPNSKGYSILIDTDQKFGSTGTTADPNYTSYNPGFEVEIELATNFGVRLYNVDGISSAGSPLVTLAYADYAQKAVALTQAGGNADYFIDFYMPFTVIHQYIPSFTRNTTIRMVANTVMAPQSALAGPVSDVSGIDDRNFGAANYSWEYLIAGQISAAPTAGTPTLKSSTPTVYNTLSTGNTTIAGSSADADGTVVTVYVNGTSVGTTTVLGGGWTKTVSTALVAGQSVTATALATGKVASNTSTAVTVSSVPSGCTASPVISGFDAANFRGVTGTAPAGATIRVYSNGTLQANSAGATSVTADASGNWAFAWCTTGNHCIPCGTLTATATSGTSCTSASSAPFCYSSGTSCLGATTTATPTMATNPISPATTSVTGTATAASVVTLYVNGYLMGTSTLAAGVTAYSFSGIQYRANDVVSVRAKSGLNCTSAAITRTATDPSAAPTVFSPLWAGASSVSGYSSEPFGSTIKVFKNGTQIGTTTVGLLGLWSLTGISSSILTASSLVTATAIATGKTESAASNSVTVTGILSLTTATPAITGSYTEGSTTISGTAPAGSTVTVYEDGVQIGTLTANVLTGAWALSGLTVNDLYAGGVLTAKAKDLLSNESAASTGVTVGCAAQADKTVTPSSQALCAGGTGTIQVASSSATSLYTLRNAANTADAGSSVLGTGGTISLSTATLSAAGSNTYKIQAYRTESPYCSALLLSTAPTITVNAKPNSGLTVGMQQGIVCTGSSSNVLVSSSQSGLTYQLKNNASGTNIGSPATGNGGTLSLPTGAITGNAVYKVLVTDATQPTNCSATLSQTASVVANCPAAYTVATAKIVDSYISGSSLATVADADNGVASAALSSGSLPAGVGLDASTGKLFVSNASILTAGTYSFSVTTTDGNGYPTVNPVSLTILPDQEALYSIATAKPVTAYDNGNTLATVSDADGSISSSYLSAGSLPAGTGLAANGKITVTDATLLVAGTYPASVYTADAQGGGSTSNFNLILNADKPANPYKIVFTGFAGSSTIGQQVATVLDSNGSITVATVTSGGWPTGIVLWPDGRMTVSDPAQLVAATYNFTIRTTDVLGGRTTQTVSLTLQEYEILPVRLTQFGAREDGNTVTVNWETAQEVNAAYFDVERSADNTRYEHLGRVRTRGNSSARTQYRFLDALPLWGQTYYRLRQVDVDGSFTFSPVVAIRREAGIEPSSILTVYPNPAEGFILIKTAVSERARFEVLDLMGHRVGSGSLVAGQETQEYRLDLTGFASGTYVLSIQVGGATKMQKFQVR